MSQLWNNNEERNWALLASALFLLFCGLGMYLFLLLIQSESVEQPQNTAIQEPVVIKSPVSHRPVYKLDNIDDIQRVLTVADQIKPQPRKDFKRNIQAAILPHHTLIAEEIGKYWQNIAEFSSPSVIVLVAPAHNDQGQELVQTTIGDWRVNGGEVKTDDAIIKKIVSMGVISNEPQSFENEHSIALHTPYISKLFPNTKIVPIIAKSSAGRTDVDRVLIQLTKYLPKDALIISSLDFSHYTTLEQSKILDQETIEAIKQKNYRAIDNYSGEHVDSSFALDFYLRTTDAYQCNNRQVWHDHSSTFDPSTTIVGTSYLVYYCGDQEEPITLSAAGDVMLARGVDRVLDGLDNIHEAIADPKKEFIGSDMVFVNLESVFSDAGTTCAKAYCFKAEPRYVDILNQIGVTHVSVANNHNYDFSKISFDDSIEILDEAEIEHIGDFQNANKPVVTKVKDKTYVFLAFDEATYNMTTQEITDYVKSAPEGDVKIVTFHWGAEYHHNPNSTQVALGHAAIDAGADLVIGHHPHVLQGIEKYNDGLILYSLGNFYFDQAGKDENESLIAKITWTGQRRTLELVPMRIRGWLPKSATEEEVTETLSRIASWSDSSLTEQIESGRFQW